MTKNCQHRTASFLFLLVIATLMACSEKATTPSAEAVEFTPKPETARSSEAPTAPRVDSSQNPWSILLDEFFQENSAAIELNDEIRLRLEETTGLGAEALEPAFDAIKLELSQRREERDRQVLVETLAILFAGSERYDSHRKDRLARRGVELLRTLAIDDSEATATRVRAAHALETVDACGFLRSGYLLALHRSAKLADSEELIASSERLIRRLDGCSE